MAGLFGDSWDDPRSMAALQMGAGLLAAGGTSRNPTNLGLGLLGGLNQYQEVMAQAKRQKMMDEEMGLRRSDRELRDLQFQQQKEAQERALAQRQSAIDWIGQNRPDLAPLASMNLDEAIKRAFPGEQEAKVVPAGAALVQGGKPLFQNPREETPPEIVKLMRVRDSLPPDDPNRLMIDMQIRKMATHAPPASTTVNVNEGQRGFDNTRNLRTEYSGLPETRAYKELQTTADIVRTSLKTPSPANDLAAATKFMKMLDPGSVVRESELAMAMSATGLLDRIGNYHNTLLKGEKLTPAQREDFYKSTEKIFAAAEAQQRKVAERYRTEASRWGLDPDAVIPAIRPPSINGKEIPAVGEVRNGYRFMGGDPANQASWRKE